MDLVYGTFPYCAACAAEHEPRCKGTHVANFTTEPGFCVGERRLKPNAPHVVVPVLCVSERAVDGTLEEIEWRRELRKEENGSHARS